jgi:hypothetical protein
VTVAATFAGHSVAATRKLLQERGETFRDRLVGGIVLGPEPLPEFPQPWPSGQDVTTFGLPRPTLPALDRPTPDYCVLRRSLTCARGLSTKHPLLLKTSMKI